MARAVKLFEIKNNKIDIYMNGALLAQGSLPYVPFDSKELSQALRTLADSLTSYEVKKETKAETK